MLNGPCGHSIFKESQLLIITKMFALNFFSRHLYSFPILYFDAVLQILLKLYVKKMNKFRFNSIETITKGKEIMQIIRFILYAARLEHRITTVN